MRTLRDNVQAGQAVIRSQNEDSRRGDFLRALDASAENLSEFEVSFLESFIKERSLRDPALDFQWFTPRKRDVVDNMIHRYGMRTTQPPPGASAKLPTAEAGHCGYLVRDGDTNRRVCCNLAATSTTGRGLELCAEHTRTRAAELEHLRQAKANLLRR